MPPAWRLATSSLSGRRRRSALLAAAVALSAALIAAVACTMASVNNALTSQVQSTIGAADLRIRPAGAGATLPSSLAHAAAAWPESAAAAGRLQGSVSLAIRLPVLLRTDDHGYRPRTVRFAANALAHALPETTPRGTALFEPPPLIQGRHPAAADEIAIDVMLAERLGWRPARDQLDGFQAFAAPSHISGARPQLPERAPDRAEAERLNRLQRVRLGDRVEVVRQVIPGVPMPEVLSLFRTPDTLAVVGIVAQPPLGGRPQAYLTLDSLARLTGQAGRLSQVDILLEPGTDPELVASAYNERLGPSLIVQTTEKVTSGLDQNIRSSQLGFVLATVMAFLSASFIITTGLTTSVTERQRELAILRCIGASRGQLARSQLLVGLLLGGLGALAGIPAGVAIAAALARAFADQLPTGLVVPPGGLALGAAGALCAGLAGAAWPAWRASRTTPVEAMAARAARPRRRGILLVLAIGLACIAAQLLIVGVPRNGQVVFWGYATFGLPVMFAGYFLLGVPMILLVARAMAPGLSRVLRLPARLLAGSVGATPYRHGFTAGALMAGLALMVALWTNAGAIMRDWLDKIEFPDAFVSGPFLTPQNQAAIQALPFVARTSAVTLHPVETDVFGVRALQRYKTTFVAFEPGPFLEMTRLTWVQGNPGTARRRLEEGGAVIVAREFLIARGLGVGHTFTATDDRGADHHFEIVGVVASPGLEIVSKFFNVGEEYADQAVHAVFGSRRDLRERFHSDAIHMIQIDLAEGVDDELALHTIRRALLGAGILDAGSGRQLKAQILDFASRIPLVVTSIAGIAMLISSLGVANLVIAGIDARRFEFGVLRALGAQRGLLARLVVAETLLVAITAAILGTLMGIQGSWAGQRLYALLLGLDLRLRPPILPIAAGWLMLIALTLAAAWPAIRGLNRRTPRDLLAATRG